MKKPREDLDREMEKISRFSAGCTGKGMLSALSEDRAVEGPGPSDLIGKQPNGLLHHPKGGEILTTLFTEEGILRATSAKTQRPHGGGLFRFLLRAIPGQKEKFRTVSKECRCLKKHTPEQPSSTRGIETKAKRIGARLVVTNLEEGEGRSGLCGYVAIDLRRTYD